MSDYRKLATLYSMVEYYGTGYLVYRDLPELINKYLNENINTLRALDYGCGTGDSTRILTTLGFNDVIGVDVDEKMLSIAKSKDKKARFKLISNADTKLPNESIDIVLSCLVLMEVSTLDNMTKIFNEISRVLKNNGMFILVVSNENLYKHDWLTVNTNFQENQNLKSGDVVRVELTDINLTILDYYWKEEDYINAIEKSNLELIEKVYALGTDHDVYNWISEYKYAPYSTFILRKRMR
ncbi:MAG: class I SAM-dependent methyltransferase [Burkholderiales bacterium]|nr:class I SAM-dependent methyltransferase [Burkholderiales bacterium]